MGLPDVRFNNVSKGEIKRAIIKHSRAKTKGEVDDSRKVGDRAEGDQNLHVPTQHQNMDESEGQIYQRGEGKQQKVLP